MVNIVPRLEDSLGLLTRGSRRVAGVEIYTALGRGPQLAMAIGSSMSR